MSKIKISGRREQMQPNVQNIPLRTDLGAKLRKALQPQPSRVLLNADYNGLEIRLMAQFAEMYERGVTVDTAVLDTLAKKYGDTKKGGG